jgi:hypothetical protein
MGLDNGEFQVRQLSGLGENLYGHCDLPQVMESTANLQRFEARRGETHGFGNGRGDMGRPLLMLNRIRVPGSDGCFHNLDDSLHEPFLPAATLKPLADRHDF